MSTTPEEMLTKPHTLSDGTRKQECRVCGHWWDADKPSEHGPACPVPVALAAAREEGRAEADAEYVRDCVEATGQLAEWLPESCHWDATHGVMVESDSTRAAVCFASLGDDMVDSCRIVAEGVRAHVAGIRAAARREVAEGELRELVETIMQRRVFMARAGTDNDTCDAELYAVQMEVHKLQDRLAPLVPKEGT